MASLTPTIFWAVVTIGVTGLPGFVAGAKGLIDQEFLRGTSRFQVTCLAPCLIFTTFGSRLTLERLSTIWPLTLWSCLQLCAGFAVSRALVRVLCSATWAKQPVFAILLQLAVCFQNIAAFSLPMLQTLCQAEGLFEGHGDNCFEDGTLMVFGYHIPWDVAMWTLGDGAVRTLSHVDPPSDRTLASPKPLARKSLLRPVDRLASKIRSCRTAMGHLAKPQFIALSLGILVGIAPPLRHLFFSNHGILAPVGAGAKRAGGIMPVFGLQILGGSLGCTCREVWAELKQRSSMATPNGGKDLGIQSKLSWIIAIMAGRLLLVPALGFILLAALSREGGTEVFPRLGAVVQAPSVTRLLKALTLAIWPADRLLRTVVLMQWSAPSCLMIIALCHRVNLNETVTHAVSALYLFMYAAAIVTTTFWVSAGLTLL